MNRSRREALRLATALATLPCMTLRSWAQAYPQQTARIIVGFPAGGSADVPARVAAQWLSARLSQQFIVENRPGAGSKLATEAVARSAPDGYTLLLINPTIAIIPAFDPTDTTHRSIEPVAGIIRTATVIVVDPSLPIRSVPDLITYANTHPGQVNFGSSGVGTTLHLAGELFKLRTGIDMVHVPYRGSPQALTDIMAGRIQVMFDTIPTSTEHIKAGTLRGLAVTSATRSAVLPDLPTVAETLPGFEASVFFGLGAPKSTPSEIVARLNSEINAALAQPEIASQLTGLGATVLPGSAADFGRLIAEETNKWTKVIKSAGIKAG